MSKHWKLEKGKKKLILTKDSKNLQDAKEYKPSKSFSDFASKKTLVEYYCKPHMKDRLREYCNLESIIDVIFSGTGIEIDNCPTGNDCHIKECKNETEFKLVRKHI